MGYLEIKLYFFVFFSVPLDQLEAINMYCRLAGGCGWICSWSLAVWGLIAGNMVVNIHFRVEMQVLIAWTWIASYRQRVMRLVNPSSGGRAVNVYLSCQAAATACRWQFYCKQNMDMGWMAGELVGLSNENPMNCNRHMKNIDSQTGYTTT